MGQRRLGLGIGAVLVAAVVAVATYRVVAGSDDSPSPEGVSAVRMVDISVTGARLSAQVITPKRASARAPLIVMPASWGQPATEYRAVAAKFAAAGYVVVAYAQRGFPASTGSVDLAGAATQHDVRSVIDWALAHTSADSARIGLFGISYGAGMSLLAAADDPRIKAVVALSGWASLAQSFDVNGTPSTAALGDLIAPGRHTGTYGPTVQHLRQVLHDDPQAAGDAVRQISADRSPANQVSGLNRNHPAVMIANAFQDSLFPPYQLIDFFRSLTTPKRLQLAPGDHAGPESGALAGRQNETVDDARRWLDRYVRGEHNGIDGEGPIVLDDVRTGAQHAYKTWPVAGAQDHYPLGRPNEPATAAAASNWRVTITAGTDSGATSGAPQYSALNGYQPAETRIGDIRSRAAFVWQGPTLSSDVLVSGSPALRVALASTARTVTLFAYLYDVDGNGTGHLITMTPYTLSRLKPNRAAPATIPLQPTSWTVPSGDHLALVVDTVDPRYTSLTPNGAKITASSSAAGQTTLAVPGAGS